MKVSEKLVRNKQGCLCVAVKNLVDNIDEKGIVWKEVETREYPVKFWKAINHCTEFTGHLLIDLVCEKEGKSYIYTVVICPEELMTAINGH
jgi:hypothetical protein